MSMGSRDGLRPEDSGAPDVGASGERTEGSSSRRRVGLLVGGILAAVVIITLVVRVLPHSFGQQPPLGVDTFRFGLGVGHRGSVRVTDRRAPGHVQLCARRTGGARRSADGLLQDLRPGLPRHVWFGRVEQPASRADHLAHPDIEALRASLPGIECRWGGPTEGGTASSVNAVTTAQQDEAIALAVANGASSRTGKRARNAASSSGWTSGTPPKSISSATACGCPPGLRARSVTRTRSPRR